MPVSFWNLLTSSSGAYPFQVRSFRVSAWAMAARAKVRSAARTTIFFIARLLGRERFRV